MDLAEQYRDGLLKGLTTMPGLKCCESGTYSDEQCAALLAALQLP